MNRNAATAFTFSGVSASFEVLKHCRTPAAYTLERIGTSEEVAELAALLAFDRTSFGGGGDYLLDDGLLASKGVQ